MKDVNPVYLGWGNPRRAISITGHDVLILIDGDKKMVLQDDVAKNGKAALSAITNHTCGIRYCSKVTARMKTVAACPHDLPLYNSAFDDIWKGVPL